MNGTYDFLWALPPVFVFAVGAWAYRSVPQGAGSKTILSWMLFLYGVALLLTGAFVFYVWNPLNHILFEEMTRTDHVLLVCSDVLTLVCLIGAIYWLLRFTVWKRKMDRTKASN